MVRCLCFPTKYGPSTYVFHGSIELHRAGRELDSRGEVEEKERTAMVSLILGSSWEGWRIHRVELRVWI